eukprot:2130732-Amphidinium_carterae.2
MATEKRSYNRRWTLTTTKYKQQRKGKLQKIERRVPQEQLPIVVYNYQDKCTIERYHAAKELRALLRELNNPFDNDGNMEDTNATETNATKPRPSTVCTTFGTGLGLAWVFEF